VGGKQQNAAFQVHATTFHREDFPTLIKAAFSIVTAKVEKDHLSTLLRFVMIVRLWFKILRLRLFSGNSNQK
jgi:hypothetical protein